MAERITTMVVNVDLQCSKCYNKVKKILCKFPEIRDQVYDVKQNTVTIKVMSCCPEKIKQKIRCKGGKSIETIEIKPPEKPPPEKPKPKEPEKEKEKKKPEAALLVCPPMTVYPVPTGVCCWECYEGRDGGPCQQLGYGRPLCYYYCYYGRPVYDSWGGGGGGCNIM